MLSLLAIILQTLLASIIRAEPIELVPKMVRWPNHVDHYLCKQLHTSLGVRSYAVANLSGQLCRTYCRLIDRINGKVTYTENISPNFVRCGPFQARCVDGQCVGFNFPGGPGSAPATPATMAPEVPVNDYGAEANLAMDSAEMSTSDQQNSTATEALPVAADDGEETVNNETA